MTDVIVQYPLDPSGVNPVNKVTGDIITMVRRKVRAVAATYGAFFADSLKVYDHVTQRLLTAGTDYYAAEQYALPTARYGKSICGVVVILDETVGDQVSLTYQALGGDFSTPATSTVQVLQSLNLDDRKASWVPIIANPSTQDDQTVRGYRNTERFTFEHAAFAIDRLAHAIVRGDEVAHDALFKYIEANRGQVTPELLAQIQVELNTGLARHTTHADPHPQYYKKSDQIEISVVKKPENLTPPSGATDVSPMTSFAASGYRGLYRLAQGGAQFQVSRQQDFSSQVDLDVTVNDAVTSYTQSTPTLSPNVMYYWRVRYKNQEGQWSPWSTPTTFYTSEIGINRPSITTPASGTTLTTSTPTLTATAFAVSGGSDTHASTDWEVWSGPDGTGIKLWGVYGDTVNKTSITVVPGKLPNNVKVYPRVRFNGATLGSSSWSFSNMYDMNYPNMPTVVGEFFQAGYYAGDVMVGSDKYAILVAPKVTGETNMMLTPTANSGIAGATSLSDSIANTNALVPSGGAGQWARNLNISGYTDWQVPSSAALDVMRTNLRVDRPSVPALFNASGAQRFESTNYWSSTTSEWDRDDSYQDPPTPIYGYYTVTDVRLEQQITSNTVTKWTNDPTDYPSMPSLCPYIPPPTVPPPYTNSDNGQPGPTMYAPPNDHHVTDTGINWEQAGLPARYVTATYYTCNYGYHWTDYSREEYGIVGYEDGAYHEVYTHIYGAYQYNFGSTAAATRPSRNTTAYVRAVRLIKY